MWELCLGPLPGGAGDFGGCTGRGRASRFGTRPGLARSVGAGPVRAARALCACLSCRVGHYGRRLFERVEHPGGLRGPFRAGTATASKRSQVDPRGPAPVTDFGPRPGPRGHR